MYPHGLKTAGSFKRNILSFFLLLLHVLDNNIFFIIIIILIIIIIIIIFPLNNKQQHISHIYYIYKTTLSFSASLNIHSIIILNGWYDRLDEFEEDREVLVHHRHCSIFFQGCDDV